MACGMPEPRKLPSLDSCQKRFFWTRKEVDFAPHPVVGLVLQAGDAVTFLQALGFESLRTGTKVTLGNASTHNTVSRCGLAVRR